MYFKVTKWKSQMKKKSKEGKRIVSKYLIIIKICSAVSESASFLLLRQLCFTMVTHPRQQSGLRC